MAILEKIHPYLRNNQGTLSINSFIRVISCTQVSGLASPNLSVWTPRSPKLWHGVQRLLLWMRFGTESKVAILEKIHPYLRNNQGTLSINSFIRVISCTQA